MKKVILTVALALAASFAQADPSVGVYGGRLFATGTQSNDLVGVSVGDNLGALGLSKVGVQATFDRSTTNLTNVNRYTVSTSYDVFKLGPVQTNVRLGFAYLDPESAKASNGGAGFIGAGVAYPVSQHVSLNADYAYQKGNNITQAYNGNILTGGVKYTF